MGSGNDESNVDKVSAVQTQSYWRLTQPSQACDLGTAEPQPGCRQSKISRCGIERLWNVLHSNHHNSSPRMSVRDSRADLYASSDAKPNTAKSSFGSRASFPIAQLEQGSAHRPRAYRRVFQCATLRQANLRIWTPQTKFNQVVVVMRSGYRTKTGS